MDDSGASRHPLHIAGAKHAAVSRRILVLEFAFERVRHGLETPVRVVRRADGFARPVADRTHLVDEQEGIDQFEVLRRQGPAHDEAPAFELAVGDGKAGDFANVRHDDFSSID